MMHNFRTLLRVQLLNVWRGFLGNLGAKSKWGLLLLPLLLLSLVPLMIMIFGLYLGLYAAGAVTGQGQVILTLALTAGQLVCLMFGVFYVISAFYFSKDLKLLIPLPLRPSEIVSAKFGGILVGEYLTILPVVAPALLIYGLFADVSWTYVPFALVIFLLLPVIPLVLASLFSLVLMRVTNLRRNRDMWRVVGGLMGVGMAVVFNMIGRFSRWGSASSTNQMQQLLEQQKQLFESAGRYFPTSAWATDALRAGAPAAGFVSFALFTAIALAALFAMLWVAEKLFFGGAIGGEETRSAGKAMTQAELTRETGQARTAMRALLDREIKLMNRTPSFLMAALMPILMVPFFTALPLIQDPAILGKMKELSRFASSPLVPVIGMGIVLFLNSMSNVAATAVSREGRHFWISRTLPVPPRQQFLAKLIHAELFTAINVVIVLGVFGFLGLLTPGNALVVAVGGLLAGVVANCGAMSVDLLRPNLKWTDPQQAMKGNYNVLFGLLFIWLMTAVTGGVTALLYMVSPSLLLPGIVLFFAAAAYGLAKLAGYLAQKRYVEIED